MGRHNTYTLFLANGVALRTYLGDLEWANGLLRTDKGWRGALGDCKMVNWRLGDIWGRFGREKFLGEYCCEFGAYCGRGGDWVFTFLVVMGLWCMWGLWLMGRLVEVNRD